MNACMHAYSAYALATMIWLLWGQLSGKDLSSFLTLNLQGLFRNSSQRESLTPASDD